MEIVHGHHHGTTTVIRIRCCCTRMMRQHGHADGMRCLCRLRSRLLEGRHGTPPTSNDGSDACGRNIDRQGRHRGQDRGVVGANELHRAIPRNAQGKGQRVRWTGNYGQRMMMMILCSITCGILEALVVVFVHHHILW